MADSATRVEVFGTPALMKKLNALKGFLQSPAFRSVLEDTGQNYVDLAKRAAPVSRSPGATGLVAGGALRGSINYAIQNFGTNFVTVQVGAGGPGARYAMYVEFGTEPSMRVPINKRFMHWIEDGAGRTVNFPWVPGATYPQGGGWNDKFRSFVWHPGTRAQPFFFQHLPIVTDRLMRALARTINSEFARQNT